MWDTVLIYVSNLLIALLSYPIYCIGILPVSHFINSLFLYVHIISCTSFHDTANSKSQLEFEVSLQRALVISILVKGWTSHKFI